MYASWIQVLQAGERRRDLASVRIAVSGAARLHEAVAEAFRAVAGVPIWEGYGLTETSPLATTTAMTQEPRIGSVGLPVPDQELEVHGERGQRVERGDPGEVVLRGPNVFAGYWRAPEDTAAVLSDDGWFRTGDIGYLDDRGELRLVDRKKDLVIVSGFNVWPREVEEVLLEHPGVAGAAVVGVPDERTGEAVKAFVVPAGSGALDLEDLRAHAARHLARFKHPAEIAVVDDLPILPTGKVRRASLRDA
jgi:long-chain acyl-CoA synthetase